MATKEVIVYTCDNCPAEGTPEGKDWKKPLPKDWADMNIVTNDGVLMSNHLCPECLSVAIKALRRRTVRYDPKK
ncbi:hypothetical protein SEA_TOKKI_63 [Arthrobacter phage Tokki]|nr:hypothetical protein SEA_TOKKI_63 [Arthrobacter phage Tokki]